MVELLFLCLVDLFFDLQRSALELFPSSLSYYLSLLIIVRLACVFMRIPITFINRNHNSSTLHIQACYLLIIALPILVSMNRIPESTQVEVYRCKLDIPLKPNSTNFFFIQRHNTMNCVFLSIISIVCTHTVTNHLLKRKQGNLKHEQLLY